MSSKPREITINVPQEQDREYDDYEEERSRPRASIVQNMVKWPTRRKTLQSFIILSLGFQNMLRFAAAITVYGGVIWVTYFIWTIIIGAPLVTAEIALGRYINDEIPTVWRMVPIGYGIFYCCLINTAVNLAMSNIFIVYLIHYLISSYITHLPWSSCPQSTIERKTNTLRSNISVSKFYPFSTLEFCSGLELGESSLNFWKIETERDPTFSEKEWEAGPMVYLFIIFVLSLSINSKGIKSLEKFTTFIVVVPYLCAVIFLILTISFPGSVNRIKENWDWEWYKLQELPVWLISLEHLLGGFAIGTLLLPFVSIHSDFEDDIMVDLVIIFLTEILTTFVYSLAVLGLMSPSQDGNQTDIIVHSLSDYLAIVLWITESLENLPLPKELWSFIFYTYLLSVGIGIHSLQVTCLTDAIISLFPSLKPNYFYITCGLCIIYFIVGIPFIYTKYANIPVMDSAHVIVALLEAITLFWIYSYNKVCADFHFLMGYKPSLYYQMTWIISPLVLAAILAVEIYCQISIEFVKDLPLLLVIIHIMIYLSSGIGESIRLWRQKESPNIFKTDPSWGPHDPLVQKSRIVFQSRVITKEHIYRQELYKKHLAKPFDISEQNIVQLT